MSILTATLSPKRVNAVLEHLAETARLEPGGESLRRPAHILYGGAHLYNAGSAAKLAGLARAAFERAGADPEAFGRLVGLTDSSLSGELHARVRHKLGGTAVEAQCIDFEDGYGPRPDDVEDADAIRTAGELAAAKGDTIVGIRIKPLSAGTSRRAVRTLDLFLTSLARAAHGTLPAGLSVTLPKVTRPAEIHALVEIVSMLEDALGVPRGRTGIELMVESHRALVDEQGRSALPSLVEACDGRCVAAHLGAYDLTASLGVAAGEQSMDNPVCDTARVMMQLALAGSAVAVFDGATTILPVGDDVEKIRDAWRLHATNIRRALRLGIYQGWDLHPAQLPARFGALYAFFLDERDTTATRLRHFIEVATKATRSGQVFDDAATGQGLVNFYLRGLACGALEESDVVVTGLSLDELRSRSFARIVGARTEGAPSSRRR
jgi:citrate lyase beta subunit